MLKYQSGNYLQLPPVKVTQLENHGAWHGFQIFHIMYVGPINFKLVESIKHA